MTTFFPSDDEIITELAELPALSLKNALEDMVINYLCGVGENDFDHEKYVYRKSCYYQSYYPYTHKASWWERYIWWHFKKVDHPLLPEKTSLIEAAKFFQFMGRQKLGGSLRDDEARAFAYELPRKASDKPVKVPLDVWGESMSASGINWKKSTVNENGLSLCAVQVVFSYYYELAQLRENKASTNGKSASRGRGQPRKKDAVQAAYDYLKSRGLINFKFELKDNSEIISEKAREIKPPSPNAKLQDGPKFRTIADTIGEQYELDRAAFIASQPI